VCARDQGFTRGQYVPVTDDHSASKFVAKSKAYRLMAEEFLAGHPTAQADAEALYEASMKARAKAETKAGAKVGLSRPPSKRVKRVNTPVAYEADDDDPMADADSEDDDDDEDHEESSESDGGESDGSSTH
jgi:hypothetical protein